jgi:hypothetical protein
VEEQEEAGVHEREVGEVADVCQGGEGRIGYVGERDGPVHDPAVQHATPLARSAHATRWVGAVAARSVHSAIAANSKP